MVIMFFGFGVKFVGDDVDVTVTIFLMDDIRRLFVEVDDGVGIVFVVVDDNEDSIFTIAVSLVLAVVVVVLVVVVIVVGRFACFLSLTGWKLG